MFNQSLFPCQKAKCSEKDILGNPSKMSEDDSV